MGPDRYTSNETGLSRELAYIARLPSNSLVHHTIVKMKWTVFDTLSQCAPGHWQIPCQTIPSHPQSFFRVQLVTLCTLFFFPLSSFFFSFRPPWPESSPPPSPVHIAETGAGHPFTFLNISRLSTFDLLFSAFSQPFVIRTVFCLLPLLLITIRVTWTLASLLLPSERLAALHTSLTGNLRYNRPVNFVPTSTKFPPTPLLPFILILDGSC
ncbi:hypothetical protein LY78DRAFT_229312 [Colletotrichum sublineola]|nr:hypothetical protein LY78DRAFT_229312 [Colletotrichum sublineola]